MLTQLQKGLLECISATRFLIKHLDDFDLSLNLGPHCIRPERRAVLRDFEPIEDFKFLIVKRSLHWVQMGETSEWIEIRLRRQGSGIRHLACERPPSGPKPKW